jgi:hypothetical protein
MNILHAIIALLVFTPAWAWSNDERSYPSNDAVDEDNEIKVKSSLFRLQLYHPWTADIIFNASTVKSIRQILEMTTSDAFSNHFAGTYLSLPTADGARIGQFQSIEVNILGADERVGYVVNKENGVGNRSQCPCSIIHLEATAYFSLPRSISLSFGDRRANENNDAENIEGSGDGDDRFLQRFLDDMIYTLMGPGSQSGSDLEYELQTAVAFFSEGQGFAARVVWPISAQPSSPPTLEPSNEKAKQAPPLQTTPVPTPSPGFNGAASNISDSTPPGQPAERAMFLVGAILGGCFFAAAFFLLRKAEFRQSSIEQYKSPRDPRDEIEEIEFYPNHIRPTPSSYTSTFTPEDNKPSHLQGCMSMELYPFNHLTAQAYSDATPKASNKASREVRPTRYDDLASPSQTSKSFVIPHKDVFEVESLDDLDPLQPPSAVIARPHAQSKGHGQHEVMGQLQASSASFSILDSVWASFDGWSTCSSWPSVGSPSSDRLEAAKETATSNSSSASKKPSTAKFPAIETVQVTVGKPTIPLTEQFKPVQRDPPGTLSTTNSNDDGSFHGSVESFDSLISSCWDPNDNSTGDGLPEGSGPPPPIESSSTTSALADDVSFYPHIKFMSNPKMIRWAERARKSLATTNVGKNVGSGSGFESLATTAADQMTADGSTAAGEHPYLSVSFSNSAESSFDENGFKVVSSTVV